MKQRLNLRKMMDDEKEPLESHGKIYQQKELFHEFIYQDTTSICTEPNI